MKPTQKNVRQLYEAFPFPAGNTPHLVHHWTRLLEQCFRDSGLELEERTFLDAGCGTGDNVISFAQTFPQMKFKGIDLSMASLQRAERKRDELRLQNLVFERQDLLRYQPKETFDFVAALGVLHHTETPERSLKNLLKALKAGGFCFVDLYGYYGYQNVSKAQELINLLEPNFQKLETRLQWMEEVSSIFLKVEVPTDRSAPLYTGLVDGFLNPIAYSYKVEEAILLLEKSGLKDVEWLDRPLVKPGEMVYSTFRGDLQSYPLKAHLQKRLTQLSKKQLNRFLELCFIPFDYFLLGRKPRMPRRIKK